MSENAKGILARFDEDALKELAKILNREGYGKVEKLTEGEKRSWRGKHISLEISFEENLPKLTLKTYSSEKAITYEHGIFWKGFDFRGIDFFIEKLLELRALLPEEEENS